MNNKNRIKLGCVYFITTQSHTGIKIGFSKNVKNRLKQLQTANSEKLEVLYIIENATMDTERFYHKYFSEVYNIKGEWYDYKFVNEWIRRDKLEKKIQREMGLI